MSIDSVEMAQAFYESQNPGSRWHRLSWVEKVHYAVLAEREACAKVCEAEYENHDWADREREASTQCAISIRGRSSP